LNKKLQNLRSLCKVMIDSDQKKRPNCDEILETKKEWCLSGSDLISDLSIDSIVEFLSQKSLCTKSLENSFIKRFIKLKFNILTLIAL
jgi:hypothetical protein